jgi:hypothetical protein
MVNMINLIGNDKQMPFIINVRIISSFRWEDRNKDNKVFLAHQQAGR